MKNKKKNILNKWKKNNGGFNIPLNYFNEFEKNFQNSNSLKSSGYTIPENYFSKIEEVILKNTTGINVSGFNVPDKYFDELEGNLIPQLPVKKTKIINFKKSVIISSFAIAASLLLFFGLNNFFFDKNKYEIESIQIAEIENWIDEDLISFNAYEIDDTFNDVELVIENDYSDEIIDYLDYTDVENLIIED